MASSTVAALEFADACIAGVAGVFGVFDPAGSPPDPDLDPESSPEAFAPAIAGEGGSKVCISWRAVLILLRRPCSAILWLVRLLVRFVESSEG